MKYSDIRTDNNAKISVAALERSTSFTAIWCVYSIQSIFSVCFSQLVNRNSSRPATIGLSSLTIIQYLYLINKGSSAKASGRRTMHDLLNALPGHVDDQIYGCWRLKLFIYTNKTFNDALSCTIVYSAPVGFFAIINRGRDVDQEKVTTRTTLVRDRVAYNLPPCLMRRSGRYNDRRASSCEFRR